MADSEKKYDEKTEGLLEKEDMDSVAGGALEFGCDAARVELEGSSKVDLSTRDYSPDLVVDPAGVRCSSVE